MLKLPSLSLGSWIVVGMMLAWGCGDTSDGDGGEGGSAGVTTGGRGSGGNNSGGRSSGGSTSGGRAAMTGGTGGGSGGQAQGGSLTGGVAGGGAAGEENGGAAGSVTAGNGGAAGSATAGNGGAAGAEQPEGGAGGLAGTAGTAGSGAAGGFGGAGGSGGSGSEDPRCETIGKDETVTSHLKFTTDNECEVFVNGVSVGKSTNWGSAVTVDVSLFLHPGRKNVVAIIGTNTSSQAGNDRGIVGQLTVDAGAGTSSLLVTDAAWRVSATSVTGWTDLAFDDSTWIAATEIAAMGDGPWGNIMPNSGAKWIWSAAVPADTANKPNVESTYARREFYLSLDGLGTTSTPSCSQPD